MRQAAKAIAEKGPLALGGPIGDMILAFIEEFSPTELNQGEDRALAEMNAYFDPPKTLEELQSQPECKSPGYEQHHIVSQNKSNRERFGEETIDAPSNIVCIPRLKHEEISGYYNSNTDGPGTPRVRDKVNQLDFEAQREEGLNILREKGVLK